MAGSLGLRPQGRRRASRPGSASCVRLSCPENDVLLIIVKLVNTTDAFATRGLALYLPELLKGRGKIKNMGFEPGHIGSNTKSISHH